MGRVIADLGGVIRVIRNLCILYFPVPDLLVCGRGGDEQEQFSLVGQAGSREAGVGGQPTDGL